MATDERGMRTTAQKAVTKARKGRLMHSTNPKKKFNPDQVYLNQAIQQYLRKGGRITKMVVASAAEVSPGGIDEPPGESVAVGRIEHFYFSRMPLFINHDDLIAYYAH